MKLLSRSGVSVFSLLIASFVSALFLILITVLVKQISGESKSATNKSYLGVRHTMLKNRLKQLAMPNDASTSPLTDAIVETNPALKLCFEGTGVSCDTNFNNQEFPVDTATLGLTVDEFNLNQRTDQIGRVCAAGEPAARCPFENQVSAMVTCSSTSTCEGFELKIASTLHGALAGQNVALRSTSIPMSLAPNSHVVQCNGDEVLTSLDVMTGQTTCETVELKFCENSSTACEVTAEARCTDPDTFFNGIDSSGNPICDKPPTYITNVDVFSRNVDFPVVLNQEEDPGEATLLFIIDNSPSMIEEIEFTQRETDNMIKNLGKNAARIVIYTTSSINGRDPYQRPAANSAFQIVKREIPNEDLLLLNKGVDVPALLSHPAIPMESRLKTEIIELSLAPPVLDVRVPADENGRGAVRAQVRAAFDEVKANLDKGSRYESAYCTLARIVEHGFGDESNPSVNSVLNPDLNLATIILTDSDDYLRRRSMLRSSYECNRRLGQVFANTSYTQGIITTDLSEATYGIHYAVGYVAHVTYEYDSKNFETGEWISGGTTRHFALDKTAYPGVNSVSDSCSPDIKAAAEQSINDFMAAQNAIPGMLDRRRHNEGSAKCVKVARTSRSITLGEEYLASNACSNSFTLEDGRTFPNVVDYMDNLMLKHFGGLKIYRECNRVLYKSEEKTGVARRSFYLKSVAESIIDQIKVLEPDVAYTDQEVSLPRVVFKRMKQLLGDNGFIVTSLVPTPFTEVARELASSEPEDKDKDKENNETSVDFSKEAWQACLDSSEISSFYSGFKNPWPFDFFATGPEAEAEGFDINVFDHAQYYVQAMSTRSGLSEIQGASASVCDFSKYTAALDRFVELLKEPAPQEFSMESANTQELEFVKKVEVVRVSNAIPETLDISQYSINGNKILLNNVPLEHGDVVRVVLYIVQ